MGVELGGSLAQKTARSFSAPPTPGERRSHSLAFSRLDGNRQSIEIEQPTSATGYAHTHTLGRKAVSYGDHGAPFCSSIRAVAIVSAVAGMQRM